MAVEKHLLIWMSLFCTASARGNDIIRAEPGQSVSLPCRAPRNTDVIVAEWTRPGLELEYVMLYRDGRPDPHHQLPSYQNRVELKDREMKDGDVSMILKKVTSNDTGTYECRVIQRKTTNRKKRANLKNDPISIVHLEVHQSGGTEERGDNKGPVAGGVVLALFVVVGVVGVAGFLFYRKHRGLPGQGSTKVPPDEQSVPVSTASIKMEDEVLVSITSII